MILHAASMVAIFVDQAQCAVKCVPGNTGTVVEVGALKLAATETRPSWTVRSLQ